MSILTSAPHSNTAPRLLGRTAGLLSLICLLVMAAMTRPAEQPEESPWLLTTADFATRRVQLVAIEESGVRVVQPDGQSAQLGLNQLVRLENTAAPAAPPAGEQAPFMLHLRNGDRLAGRPLRLTETALVMQSALFGELSIPLEQLLALVARDDSDADRAWRLPPPAADVVLLANGDERRGYLSALEGDNWVFADEQGNETPLAASAVRQVRFADPGVPVPPAAESGWRVKLAGGGLLTLEALSFADGQFTLSYRGQEAGDAAAVLAWLEPVDGPVRWLSDLPLALAEQTPYLGAAFPSVADSLPSGGRGFVVRSRSRLSFDIPPGFARFRTRYAMDRSMTHGSADIRILLDDKPVHEHKALTAADSPPPVEVPLNRAKRLTLEVDYGPGLDVQDVVQWIDPALVR